MSIVPAPPELLLPPEPPVAVVDKVVDRKGSRAAAEAYLAFLYSPQGQEIAARNFYRPRDPAVAKKYAGVFPHLQLFTVQEMFGGWRAAQAKHFDAGGTFDEIYGE